MAERYVDPQGRTSPGGGRLYLGNLNRGSVVHWDSTGRTMKVVDQYSGSTLVSMPKPPRSFTPKSGPNAGEVVIVSGGREVVAVARGTIVWRRK